ncbi:transcription initiation factor TFIID [Paenibacillus sp. 481]|nr:tubulin-like doman-containing protein [Paenibacillus sp. 481]UHA75956.1 transcription initiation factor TFIID [Paenibacillus sp. 481]
MNALLEPFATEYAAAEEKLTDQGDDQSSIHYPAVFLFIGDKTVDAIDPIIQINDKKWDNSDGVMYVHIGSQAATGSAVSADSTNPKNSTFSKSSEISTVSADSTISTASVDSAVAAGSAVSSVSQGETQETRETGRQQGLSRLSTLALPVPARSDAENGKTLRKEVYDAFYREERLLVELNRMLRQVSHQIADYGRLYSSFDRIHLSIITRVDDPLNVFVPEISLLAKAIFNQSFKSVQMDLFTLISEREQVETFGYSSSVGVAFLRELDGMQRADYTFSARLQVTEDGISIPVTHAASPLFDLVYLLSDKNERGISSFRDMDDNYEIICHVSLLKNRKLKDAAHELNLNSYNNTSFKNNIMTESGRQGYVSAGFSKVKRPNESIALTVLYHFYRQLLLRMQAELPWSAKEKLTFFGLDAAAMAGRTATAVPDEGKLGDMSGIMTHDMSYSKLKRMSLREAEDALFGDGCRVYFRSNYEREAEQYVEQFAAAEQLRGAVQQHMTNQPQLSFFHIYQWTDEANEKDSVLKELRLTIQQIAKELEALKIDLEQLYVERVEDQSFQRLPLMDKHNLRSFIRCFFDKVYRHKLEILRLETELKLHRRYELELAHLHADCKRQVQQLEQLEEQLQRAATDSIRMADDYIGQNILEYYGRVTETVMHEFEAKRGATAFFEERYIGHIPRLLDQGIAALCQRLLHVCRHELLTAEPFQQTFEEELLRRANVAVDYSNKQVLSKAELFKKLYATLEHNAEINIRLFDYTHEHRYEEKYFFGDHTSEFIRYARSADETSRIYKLGCVHEKRSSGVEKLNLMGGFHLEDLMYYRNGKVYYEHYVASGYEFHGMEQSRLPELR